MARERKLQPVDWDAVAIDIRAGKLTDRQIGEKHGRTHAAIHQFAKKNGIERDLTERIQQRTQAKLSRAKLSKDETQTFQEKAIFTQDQVVEIAATVNSTIIIKQQGRLEEEEQLVDLLLAEVKAQTISKELYEQLGVFLRCPDENNRDALNDLYMKSIGTPVRVAMAKQLAEATDKLHTMQAKSYRLDREAPPASSQEYRDVPPEFLTALEDFKVKVRGAVKDTTAAA